MKKYLSILLSLVMMFSIMTVSVFATEPTDGETTPQQTHVHEDGTIHEGAEHVEGEEGTLTGGNDITAPTQEDIGYVKAKVTQAGDINEESVYGMYTIKSQTAKVKILEGKYIDKEYDATFVLTQDYNGLFEADSLNVGDKVYVSIEQNTNEETGTTTENVFVVQKMRDTNLLITGLLIAVVLLVLGTINGAKTIGLVVVNTAVAMAVVFGLYLNGVSAILSLLALVIPIIVADILIINGFKKESLIAILSVLISTIVTMGAFVLVNNSLSVIGLTEYGSFLNGVNPELLTFSFLDLIVAGTMIMTLGVTIDMALRSVRKGAQGKAFGVTLKEVSKRLPSRLNTVFLVWLGGFVTIFTIFILYARPLLEIINVETIVIELVKIMIIFLNAVIVMPIGILLSKELSKTRELSEAKIEETEKVEE